jgi:nitrogenase molybdenum-iron protein alpha/beta subunit
MIKYKPELILVISSDVSDQIGDYMDAVREEAKVPCEIVVCSLVSCEQDSVMTRRGFSIIRNALITQLLEILKPHHSNLRPE